MAQKSVEIARLTTVFALAILVCAGTAGCSELRLSLSVPGHDQSADNGEFPAYTVDELYDASLSEYAEAATTGETRYENLSGWVALDTISLRESIYVSISGTDEDGNEAAVWGHFAVDETSAAP
ncbi:MAG: hypothetical protein ACOC9W_00225 [Persicimonas sp.]